MVIVNIARLRQASTDLKDKHFMCSWFMKSKIDGRIDMTCVG